MSYKNKLNRIDTFIFDVDGVLTDGSVNISENGELLRTMNVKDGLAIKTAIDQDYRVCIISGGKNEGVRQRLRGLGVTDIYLGSHVKMEQLEEYFDIYDIDPENVLYMGDDLPDIPPLKAVGLATCPQDAVQEVKAVVDYVSHRHGGKACVRDVIEQVMKVQGKWHVRADSNIVSG